MLNPLVMQIELLQVKRSFPITLLQEFGREVGHEMTESGCKVVRGANFIRQLCKLDISTVVCDDT